MAYCRKSVIHEVSNNRFLTLECDLFISTGESRFQEKSEVYVHEVGAVGGPMVNANLVER